MSSFIDPLHSLSDPKKSAQSFILDKVKQVVEERLLPVHGQLTSIDILFSFIDRYYHVLNTTPGEDNYDVNKLANALNLHMLGVCASIASSMAKSGSNFVSLDLDAITSLIMSKQIKPIFPSTTSINFSISSRYIPIKSVFDALRNIVAADIKTINRPFIPRDPDLLSDGGWIWSGYKPEDEIQNVRVMLENAIPEYIDFIHRNRLRLPKSRYLDESTSIIYEYEPTFLSSGVGPGLREHHLNNKSQTLPKFAISIRSDEYSPIDESAFPSLIYNGKAYKAISSSQSNASFFFSSTPMLNLLYRMLAHDLSEYYGIRISPFHH